MLGLHRGPLVGAVLTLLFVALGCADSSSSSGGGGTDATLGALAIPGLWVGAADGLQLCFYVSDDGTELTTDPGCELGLGGSSGGLSYDLDVESLGVDQSGQPCGFSIDYELDVPIDRSTGAFGVSGIPSPDGEGELAFSGELTGLNASGVAQWSDGDATCQVGWGANRAAPCNEAAIESCLELQNCCRAILVNPVFFESCNSVVLECNQAECLRVLAGYPQCRDLDL